MSLKSKRMLAFLFIIVLIAMTVVPIHFEGKINGIYEMLLSSTYVNENVGSIECDHACLIVSMFAAILATSNLMLSVIFFASALLKEKRCEEKESYLALKRKYPEGTKVIMRYIGQKDCKVSPGDKGTVIGIDCDGKLKCSWETFDGQEYAVDPYINFIEIEEEEEM